MIFNIFNAVVWVVVLGLLIAAHYFPHPFTHRRQITTGHIIRSIGIFILFVWVLFLGTYETVHGLINIFSLIGK